jgi:hypothetical protein
MSLFSILAWVGVPLLMAGGLWLWVRERQRPAHNPHCDCGECARWLAERELRRHR